MCWLRELELLSHVPLAALRRRLRLLRDRVSHGDQARARARQLARATQRPRGQLGSSCQRLAPAQHLTATSVCRHAGVDARLPAPFQMPSSLGSRPCVASARIRQTASCTAPSRERSGARTRRCGTHAVCASAARATGVAPLPGPSTRPRGAPHPAVAWTRRVPEPASSRLRYITGQAVGSREHDGPRRSCDVGAATATSLGTHRRPEPPE